MFGNKKTQRDIHQPATNYCSFLTSRLKYREMHEKCLQGPARRETELFECEQKRIS